MKFRESAYLFNALDPKQINWVLYLTRFITYYCAPAFSFLAGISAFFVGRGRSPKELSLFLVKRGIWLLFIQLTVINFAWYFDPGFQRIQLDVVGSVGLSMVFLALLARTPKSFILAVSCLMIFGHNLLYTIHFNDSLWWKILHEETAFEFSGYYTISVYYPLIPWIGVMSLGYWMGKFYDKTFAPERRKKILTTVGVSAIVLFIFIRGFNSYGNPIPWIDFGSFSKNPMSILSTTKYPPFLSLHDFGTNFYISGLQ